MDNYESNCHTIRVLFGSCLSEISQHIPFWHYGILLPRKEDSSLSSVLNISLDDLKQILLCCGLIYCQRDTLKLDLNGWPTLMIENHIDQYYFDKFSVSRFNSYNPKMYYIGIGTQRNYKLTPSSQFLSDSCPRKSSSLSKKLKKNCDRMIMLLKINNMIENEVGNNSKISNNKVSLSVSSNSKTDDDASSFRVVKDLINRTTFGDDSSIMNLIKYIKETEISDCNKRLLNLINVEGSSNVSYEKLQVEETELKNNYPMLHSLHIPVIPNVISTILQEIFKLSERFPKNNLLSIKSFCGTDSTLINIPK